VVKFFDRLQTIENLPQSKNGIQIPTHVEIRNGIYNETTHVLFSKKENNSHHLKSG